MLMFAPVGESSGMVICSEQEIQEFPDTTRLGLPCRTADQARPPTQPPQNLFLGSPTWSQMWNSWSPAFVRPTTWCPQSSCWQHGGFTPQQPIFWMDPIRVDLGAKHWIWVMQVVVDGFHCL